MEEARHLSVRDARDQLSAVVERVEREHERVTITRHGRPAAMLVSIDDIESMEETISVLSRPDLVGQIRESLDELAAGPAGVLSKDEALRLISRS
jgi:prevent-host-death family protein